MLDEIAILTIVVLATTVLRQARGSDAAGRGYTLVVAAVLGLVVMALARDSAFLMFVGVALAVLLVVGPWLLEAMARWAFGRGMLQWAVRLASLRAMLMLGSGLSRQQGLLQGLALLEREGVDRAIAHFRGLAEATDDPAELALIHEQIVSMLLYGQRWDEGIAHYEARFPPRYAAVRPALALGLMRAYGESERLERAAWLLRALEEGPVGADPRSASLLSQARLTFLAYAGIVPPVEQALQDERRVLLGLSPASGALFAGIALLRAGQSEQARARLAQVERLASRREARVVDASHRALADAAKAAAVRLEPELGRYAELVARRLDVFLRAAPVLRRPGRLVATWGLMAALLVPYVILLARKGGGMALVQLGVLTPEALAAGEAWRVLSGVWAHADAVAVLLNLYALWLAAPMFERMFGAGRLLVAGLGGSTLGLLAAARLTGDVVPSDVAYGGAHLVAVAIVSGASWTALRLRLPGLAPRARRAVVVPLLFVFVAEALCLVPGVVALDVPIVGWFVALLVGLTVVILPARAGAIVGTLGLPWALAIVFALGWAWRSDATQAYMAGAPRRIEIGGERRTLPRPFAAVTERADVAGLPLPLQPGAVDTLAVRRGDQVQLVAAHLDAAPGPKSTVLFAVDPSLRHELTASVAEALPEAFAQALAAAGGRPAAWRWVTLRRNGETVGHVVEPRLEGPGRRIALVVAPPTALAAAPEVYAQVLASR